MMAQKGVLHAKTVHALKPQPAEAPAFGFQRDV